MTHTRFHHVLALLFVLVALGFLTSNTPAGEPLDNASRRLVTVASASSPAQGARILVEHDHMLFVSGDTLAKLGAPVPMAADQLRVYSPDGEVAVKIQAGEDGSIDGSTKHGVLFWATFPRGEHTTRQIGNEAKPYWIVWDADAAKALARRLQPESEWAFPAEPRRWTIMTGRDAKVTYPDAMSYHHTMRRFRYERDRKYRRWLGADPTISDFYIDSEISTAGQEVLTLGNIYSGHRSDPALDDPRYVDFMPHLRVKMFGISRFPNMDGSDHLVDVAFNGEPVGRVEWNGVHPIDWETTFPLKLLTRASEHQLTLSMPEERLDQVDQVYFDWFELSYPYSSGSAKTDYEMLSSEKLHAESESVILRSSGWADGVNVRAFDPASNTVFEPVNSQQHSSVWRHEFYLPLPDPRPTDHQYVIFAETAPTPLAAADATAWSAQSAIYMDEFPDDVPAPQNLIITHKELWPAARKLAAYRSFQGITTWLVDVDDVYDGYSQGYIAPEAISAFIKDVIRKSHETPSYLTLFGDSSFDHKGLYATYMPERGINSKSMLPVYYEYSAQKTRPVYPADQIFVIEDDKEVPLMAVGRIPAANLSEAEAYVAKVLEYERAGSEAAWRKKALLVSSWERSFSTLLERVEASQLIGFETQKLIAELDSRDDDVAMLEDSLNEGCGVLYYVGHGGSFVWRVGPVDFNQQEDLFTTENIAALTNERQYPIVFVSSCYTVSFEHAQSLGESFLLEPDRGAIAVIGSPWKTSVHPNHQFNSLMMGYLYSAEDRFRNSMEVEEGTPIRIGDAFLAAKLSKQVRGAAGIGFTLLGDPCLLVIEEAGPKWVEPEVEDEPESVATSNDAAAAETLEEGSEEVRGAVKG